MRHLDDSELLERFRRRLSGIEAEIPATPPRSRPTIAGRTQTMFSAVRAMTAGALVFAIGGALLIAQPFGQGEDPVPAVEGDAGETGAAWVSGTIALGHCPDGPERVIESDRVQERGWRCGPQRWETSDARLTGESVTTWNADVYRLDGPDATVISGVYELQTGSGSWICRYGPTPAQGSGLAASTRSETATCAGRGAHDGLTAVLDLDLEEGHISGLIFPGEAPPRPGSSAADQVER